MITKTSPHGVNESPIHPIPVFLSYDISFVARTAATQIPEMVKIIRSALLHPGMSLVYVFSPCMIFPIITYKNLKEIMVPLPGDHPIANKIAAMEKAYSDNPVYTGIFYQIEKKTLEDHLQDAILKSSFKTPDRADNWDHIKDLFKDYS